MPKRPAEPVSVWVFRLSLSDSMYTSMSVLLVLVRSRPLISRSDSGYVVKIEKLGFPQFIMLRYHHLRVF